MRHPRPVVKNHMSSMLFSVLWNQPMAAAWKKMQEANVRHLVVLNKKAELEGILSDRDVKRAMDPGSPSFNRKAKVGDYMTWPVMTAQESVPLSELLDAMIEKKISAIVIMKGAEPAGITTSEDMLRLLSKLLKEQQGRSLTLLDFRYSPFFHEAIREASAAGL